MEAATNWQKLRKLGEGGQSTVYLVRNPKRRSELDESQSAIQQVLSGSARADLLVRALAEQLRPDSPEELGALKVFDKVRDGGAAPIQRIEREIEILSASHPGLPKLLTSNVAELWMITEFFPEGSLDKSPKHFEGDARRALIAFRSLVEAIAHLHSLDVVHRDIKPANVFLSSGKLVPGDFGIAYKDDAVGRFTGTHERVGPWEYMPQWADTGERLEEIRPSSDVYMLGKLLWCMISGRPRLPREYHRRPGYDLSKTFPQQPQMEAVNALLDSCLVEHESECLDSAADLLVAVDETIATMDVAVRINVNGKLELPCLMCHRGLYTESTSGGGRVQLSRFTSSGATTNGINVRVFSCNVCNHQAFFAPGFPEQAVKNNWRRS